MHVVDVAPEEADEVCGAGYGVASPERTTLFEWLTERRRRAERA
jgi:hypothetical protein